MKHLLITLGIFLLAFLLVWIAEQGGTVEIAWGDWQIATSPIMLLVGVLLGGLALFLLLEGLTLLFTLPSRIRRAHTTRQQRSGLNALGQGMAALALNDHDMASREIARSRVLLKEHPASLMLASQLAHRQGNTEQVESLLLKLQQHQSTQAVAARGLWQISLGRGDWQEARRQAETLLQSHPGDTATRVQLLGIMLHEQQWDAAEKLIRNAGLRRRFTAQERKHYRAVAAYLQAKTKAEHGPARLELLKKAVRLDPGLSAAATLYASDLNEMGKAREAEKVLRKSWHAFQHPDVAEAWHHLQLGTPIEKRNARLLAFLKGTEQSLETQLWLARYYLNSGDTSRARTHAQAAQAIEPDIRAERLLSALHDTDNSARLDGASTTMSAPVWLCGHCQKQHKEWLAWCLRCRQFDSIGWQRPPAGLNLQEIITAAA